MGRISRKIVGVGSALALAILALDAALLYPALLTIAANNSRIDQLRQVVAEVDRALTALTDAETGQRGYLLTGREAYLGPFIRAESEVDDALARLRPLVAGDDVQRGRVADLDRLAAAKMAELRQTIALRREQGLEAALKVVETDQGKNVMDQSRRAAFAIRDEVNRALRKQIASSRSAVRRAFAVFGLPVVVALVLLSAVQHFRRLDESERERAATVLAEKRRLAEFARDVGFALTESASLKEMLTRCAEVAVARLDGAFCRVWTVNEAGDVLELQASAGMYTHTDGPHGRVPIGEYKIGQIARERKPHLTNSVIGDPRVPAQDWAQREGMVAFAGYPLVVEDRLVGVWAMFARHALSDSALRALESVSNAIALGVERKRGAEALAKSEAWLSTTLASIGDAVIATDGEGRVRFMNPVAEALTGWPQGEASQRPMEQVFQIINEQTRRPVEHPVAKVIREGGVVGLANHSALIARDGTERPIEDSAAPIRDENGAVAGVVMVFRDVSETRAAENLLRASEARKAAILQTALDAVVTIDAAGLIVEFNPAAERIFGCRRADVLGKEMCDLIIPPAFREAHRQGMAHCLATGEGPILGKRIEVVALRADGLEFPAELAVTRIPVEGPPLFTAHLRDVGDRQRVEAERLRLISIIEHSPDFIGLADADRKVWFVNRAGRRLVGLDDDADVGATSVLDYFPEDERQRVEREIMPVLLEKGQWDGEVSFRNFQTGARVPVAWNAFTLPGREAGKPYFACVSRNITERKRAEQRLGFLAEAGTALASSLDYKETLGNIARQAVTGFADFCFFDLALDDERIERVAWAHADPRRQSAMDRIGEFAPPRRSESHPVARTMKTGRTEFVPAVDDSWIRTTSFGPDHYEFMKGLGLSSLVCVPVPSRGRVAGALTFCHNDPSRGFEESDVRLAEDLGRRAGVSLHNALLYREAEEANRAKSQFLAVLSHELRTPLNPILLAVTSMLERPISPDDVRPNLEMIRQYVNLQARLIDDLLDVMRIVRGKMPLHWEVVDCHALLHRTIPVCRSEILGKELALVLELNADRRHVNADPARLQQVFWNLVKNAVKFTPGKGTITIRTRNELDQNDRAARLVIEVSDTGIGIAPEVLPRIFDPFQQGESSITRRFGGMGLGLAICKGVVEGHGGLLTADSAGEGLGTTFRIEMRTLPEPRNEDADRPGAAAAPEEPQRPRPRKILLVEDEAATLRLMAKLLRGLGHEVTTAGTIASARQAEGAGDFDLIISDVGLPDGSGLELMRGIVARRGRVPAIALTGYGMEEDIQRSREAGFTAHMTKPIDFTKLEAMIHQIAP